jgi:hypothetical protein
MADARRFPRLEAPFAIVGASAGWLGGGIATNPGLVATPLDDDGLGIRVIATVFATVFAIIVGTVLRRWCAGAHYRYQLVPSNPDVRAPTDVWWRHLAVILGAGGATGVIVTGQCKSWLGPGWGALSGVMCTLAFVPVCFAVLASARRAQRARLGSIVAASDRMAVWSILATTVGVATLEALPDWPAANLGDRVPLPLPALGLLVLAGIVVGVSLARDVRAGRRARDAVIDLEACSEEVLGVLPRLDLGLGDSLGARNARSPSPYRGSDRMLGLVEGDPALALRALDRAKARGVVCLLVLVAVVALHGAANGSFARDLYQVGRAGHCAWQRLVGETFHAL